MFKLFDLNKPHTIYSTVHKYLSGYRVLTVKNRSSFPKTLTIELETKGGEVSIYIDTNNDVHENHKKAETQTLSYVLNKGDVYKITIISRRHVGKFKITTKVNKDEEK